MGGEKRDDDDDDDDDEEQEEGEERRNGGYERKRTTTIRPNPGDLHVNRRTMVSSGLKQSLKVLKYSIMLAAALSVESPFLHADAMAATSSHQREDHDIHVDGAGEDDPDHAAGGTVTPHDESDPSPKEKKKTTTTTTTTTTRGHQVGKDLVHARQAAFRCDRSDALGSLRALCAFEKAGETEHFARLHHLHARHLREMAALHRQLASIVTDVILVGSSRHHGEGEEHMMDRDDAGDDDDGVHHLPEIGQPLAPTTSPPLASFAAGLTQIRRPATRLPGGCARGRTTRAHRDAFTTQSRGGLGRPRRPTSPRSGTHTTITSPGGRPWAQTTRGAIQGVFGPRRARVLTPELVRV